MEIIKNYKNDQELTLVMSVTPSDYNERVEKELKNFAKKVSLKGFRPGNVPKDLVKKMYGKSILAEEVSKLVDEKLNEFIKEENIDIIGEILPSETEKTEFDIENSDTYKFAFDIAFYKDLKIDLQDLKVPFYNIKIDEQKLDEEINNLKKRYGKYEDSEVSNSKSLLELEIKELDGEKVKENGIVRQNVGLLVERLKPAEQKTFENKKIGDTFIVNVKNLFENQADLRYFLSVEQDQLEQISEFFEVKITKIQNFVEAELNQELFDKAFGKDKVKTVEEAKEELKRIYKENYQKQSLERFYIDIKNELMNKYKVPLPEEFVVRWQKDRQNKTEEEIRKNLKFILEVLKWDRILTVLAKQLEIKVEYDDLLKSQKNYLIEMFINYGLDTSFLSDDTLTHYASENLKKMKDDEIKSLYINTFERKILEALADKVQKVEKEITFEELKKIYDEEYSKRIAEEQ